MITPSNWQPFEGASPIYSFNRLLTTTSKLNGAIKALTKDSEIFKSTKETTPKSLIEERGSAKKLAEELKSTREDALKDFRELEAFHEEAMPMTIRLIAEDGQGDTVVTEEEDPSAALQLNRRCSRSSDRDPPSGPTQDEAMEVP
nr:hypothetical protein Iba_chr06bCG13240 [Ipomoea batatas]